MTLCPRYRCTDEIERDTRDKNTSWEFSWIRLEVCRQAELIQSVAGGKVGIQTLKSASAQVSAAASASACLSGVSLGEPAHRAGTL